MAVARDVGLCSRALLSSKINVSFNAFILILASGIDLLHFSKNFVFVPDVVSVLFPSLFLNLCVLYCFLSSFYEVMLTLPVYDSGRNVFFDGLDV